MAMHLFLVCTSLSNTLHLPGASPMSACLRLWNMSWCAELRATLLCASMVVAVPSALSCCRRVWTWVSSLGQVNGPARQLLVFRLSLSMWLSILVVVASTTMVMGTWPVVMAVTIVLLDNIGRLWLSSTTLMPALVRTPNVLMLAAVRSAVHFLQCSVLLNVVVSLWLLLMTRTCTTLFLEFL